LKQLEIVVFKAESSGSRLSRGFALIKIAIIANFHYQLNHNLQFIGEIARNQLKASGMKLEQEYM
jgi:hypothetical protein